MTLDFYLARRFLRALLIVSGAFSGLTVMIEMLEQVRRFGGSDINAGGLFSLALLRLPASMYELLPIVVALATLVMFLGLARSSELVVTRAAGRSALRALVPPVIVAFVFGLLTVAVLNPLSAAAAREYEQREAEIAGGGKQAFSVSDEGLWLREGDADGQTVIRATRSNTDASILWDVTFLGFAPDGTLNFRIEAEEAKIGPENWTLSGAKYWPLADTQNPEAMSTLHDTLQLPTQLSPDEIRDRFGKPNEINIWDLSAFIEKLEAAGFSARAYKMWFQSELALPLTFIAMVLIAAGFTMRHTRLGGTAPRVLIAIILAFLFFFLRNFANILGQSGEVPIALAAWGAPLAIILAATALLLHLEDG
ncbi:LPS export ABC transporter permease LptG [Celeribacter sp.]|uniref:LPS export ABC transporter permease LptG n=1 Tax=Celeribacter sp. TaxID=1890673 RepID=UPI003A8D89D7